MCRFYNRWVASSLFLSSRLDKLDMQRGNNKTQHNRKGKLKEVFDSWTLWARFLFWKTEFSVERIDPCRLFLSLFSRFFWFMVWMTWIIICHFDLKLWLGNASKKFKWKQNKTKAKTISKQVSAKFYFGFTQVLLHAFVPSSGYFYLALLFIILILQPLNWSEELSWWSVALSWLRLPLILTF